MRVHHSEQPAGWESQCIASEIIQNTSGRQMAVPVPWSTPITHLHSKPIPSAHMTPLRNSHAHDLFRIPPSLVVYSIYTVYIYTIYIFFILYYFFILFFYTIYTIYTIFYTIFFILFIYFYTIYIYTIYCTLGDEKMIWSELWNNLIQHLDGCGDIRQWKG